MGLGFCNRHCEEAPLLRFAKQSGGADEEISTLGITCCDTFNL